MKTLLLFTVITILTSCASNRSGHYGVGNVAMIVGFFPDYYDKPVRVVGYLDRRPNASQFELIPSKEHIALKPPASILSLMLFPNEGIRNGNVASELGECLGKTTYVHGVVGTFSGLPVINGVSEVAC